MGTCCLLFQRGLLKSDIEVYQAFGEFLQVKPQLAGAPSPENPHEPSSGQMSWGSCSPPKKTHAPACTWAMTWLPHSIWLLTLSQAPREHLRVIRTTAAPPTEAGSKDPKMLQLQPHILKTMGTKAFPAPRAHSGWTYPPNTPPAPGGTKGEQFLLSGVLLQSCSRAGAGCFEFPTLLRCNERRQS